MIHALIDDCSEIVNLEKFVPRPKVILFREEVFNGEKLFLKVNGFQNKYNLYGSLEVLKKPGCELTISEQKLFMGVVISFFASFICSLPSKKEQLEVFNSLTPSFKEIYESLYEALKL